MGNRRSKEAPSEYERLQQRNRPRTAKERILTLARYVIPQQTNRPRTAEERVLTLEPVESKAVVNRSAVTIQPEDARYEIPQQTNRPRTAEERVLPLEPVESKPIVNRSTVTIRPEEGLYERRKQTNRPRTADLRVLSPVPYGRLHLSNRLRTAEERASTLGTHCNLSSDAPVPPHRIIENPNPKKRQGLLVVAIDFGTTYSGYAYSFTGKPGDIKTNLWHGKNTNKTNTVKKPTVLLLKPDQSTHSFGDEAIDHYRTLSDTERRKWYLFEKFKMKLFISSSNGLLDKDMKLKDFHDKEMLAIDVFSKSITFMKNHLEQALARRQETTGIKPDKDIHWVLTVPAIWNDLAKHFMREAARRAGIPDEMLTLALEPEAASVWCIQEFGVSQLPIGSKYTLLDLGGGTGDISIHERCHGHKLKELLPPKGGAFGGTKVNEKFLDMLSLIFGNTVLKSFKDCHPLLYRELLDQFEEKKRSFDGSKPLRIALSLQLRDEFKRLVGEPLNESLANSAFKEFKVLGDKLTVSKRKVAELFDDVANGIVDELEQIENQIETDCIILVGGFSCYRYIQEKIKGRFGKKLKIPRQPDLVVLKGAVLYGHNPDAILARRCKNTYGIARMMLFKPGHKTEKKNIICGKEYVDGLFNKHISIGEEVRIDEAEKTKAHEYFPPTTEMKYAVLEVYASNKENPMYIDDEGCNLVGLIKLDIDPQGDIFSKIKVKMIFGGTELIVEAHDEKNNKTTRQSIDFLG